MPSVPPIAGLGYVPGYLNSAEQRNLIATIDGAPCRADLSRRV